MGCEMVKELKGMYDFETVGEYYAYCAENNLVPRCPYCEEALIIRQTETIELKWTWKEGKFIKSELDGEGYKPQCSYCEHTDWEFIDNTYASY